MTIESYFKHAGMIDTEIDQSKMEQMTVTIMMTIQILVQTDKDPQMLGSVKMTT
jgi:hypothetical protein